MTVKRTISIKSFQVIIQKKKQTPLSQIHTVMLSHCILQTPAEYKKLIHCNCFLSFYFYKALKIKKSLETCNCFNKQVLHTLMHEGEEKKKLILSSDIYHGQSNLFCVFDLELFFLF